MKSNFKNTLSKELREEITQCPHDKDTITPFKSPFGGELRDNVMQFQLDNEVGSLLKVEKDESGEKVKISLVSKNNQDLGHGEIDLTCNDLISVYLNHKEKRLEFTLRDETKVYCYLDDLYNSKQDKLISGENLSTINEHDLLLGGDVHLPYVEKSNVNGNIILDKEETSVYTLGLTINGQSIVDSETNTANIPLDLDIKNDSENIGATTHAIKTYVDINIEDASKYFSDEIKETQENLNSEITNRKSLAGHSIKISQDKEHVIDIDLVNTNGESISHQEINLDSEHIIDRVDLDYENKKLIFTFKDGHTLDCDISNLINDLNKKISDESTRATNKEKELQDNLDNEIKRAKDKESELQSKLESEASTRKTNDDTITTNLNKEIERATNKENELDTSISNIDEKQTQDLNKVKDELTKKINDDIDALDVERVGEDGKYLKYISEENGKIVSELNTFDTTIGDEASNINAPTTFAVKDYVDTNVNTLNTRVTNEVETLNNTITVKESALNKTIQENDEKQTTNLNKTKEDLITKINDDINSLDVDQVGEDGKYIKFIKEENGKIETILNSFETLVNDENASEINAPTSKAIKTYVDDLVSNTKSNLTTTINELDAKLTKSINDNYSTLDNKIDTTKSDLQNELKTTLESYYTKSEIDEQEKTINSTITTLDNKVNTNNTNINNKVDELNKTLTQKINEDVSKVQTTLQGNIDKVVGDLSTTKESLEASDKQLQTNIDNLNTSLREYVNTSISTLDTSLKSEIQTTKEELESKINLTYEVL